MKRFAREPTGSQACQLLTYALGVEYVAHKMHSFHTKDLDYNLDFLSSRVDFNKFNVVIGPFKKSMAPYMNKQAFDFRTTFVSFCFRFGFVHLEVSVALLQSSHTLSLFFCFFTMAGFGTRRPTQNS